MKRRQFITLLGGVAAWPRATRAQQGERVRRIGMLNAGGYIAAFRDGLAKLGWVEAHNLRIDLRVGGGDADRIRGYAAELTSLAPDVIVTSTVAATKAVQQLTQTIPIVISGAGDVSTNGIVKNIARPEGNTTGITNLYASIGGKWLELLKEAAPRVERVALVFNAQVSLGLGGFFPSIAEATRLLDVKAIKIPYLAAVDLAQGIDAFASEPNAGLIVLPPPPTGANRMTILRLAAQHRLPTIYPDRSLASDGGLMAYGSDVAEVFRRASYYVDRILRGTKVSELPVEFPTKFELVINLKTAKAIGLDLPPTLLNRADEVIE
jgi:putative ABC transport system substrate-binding protein